MELDPSETEHFPIVDALDHEILMHRDAHFGGLFSIMLEYYKKEGKGVQPSFDIPRIEKLAALEGELKQNLAALFLDSSEMEKVADSRQIYQKLRDIYEIKSAKNRYPQLIADLILSEEEEPQPEIAAIVQEKEKIIPALIDLLRNEDFYDPLFPGYGLAPFLAVTCLGRLGVGDKKVIISLLEALGQGDFFADEQIIGALKAIGDPARDFLLHVVNGRPLNEDNEKAAIALVAFKDDQEVANFCFNLLGQPDVQKDPCLPTYLVLICAGLTDPVKRHALQLMGQETRLPLMLRKDIQSIVREWTQ